MNARAEIWGAMPDAMRRVVQSLAACFVAGDAGSFARLSGILRARLEPARRASLAWAAMEACDDADRELVIGHFVRRAETPMEPLVSLAAEARMWAADASPHELKFYAFAAAVELGPVERAALRDKLIEMEVAA